MPKKETLSQFAKNLKKFNPLLMKRIVKNWQDYTEESFADSQEKVPILTGDLLRSGAFKEARITRKGVESYITYTMPYSKVIHSGERNGEEIELKEKGFKYPHATKSRKGEFKYLSSAIEANEPKAKHDIKESISQAWGLI